MAIIGAARVRRAPRVVAAGVCLAALCVAGCMSPNTRTTEIGKVSAYARLKDGVASYYQVEIGQPLDPHAPRIWFKLPEGKIIDRPWFVFKYLEQAGFVNLPDKEYQPGSPYSHELTRSGVAFCFSYGTLEMIRLTETAGIPVGIGLEHGKEFYTLPLSQEQLEKLFGKPDRMSDKFHL